MEIVQIFSFEIRNAWTVQKTKNKQSKRVSKNQLRFALFFLFVVVFCLLFVCVCVPYFSFCLLCVYFSSVINQQAEQAENANCAHFPFPFYLYLSLSLCLSPVSLYWLSAWPFANEVNVAELEWKNREKSFEMRLQICRANLLVQILLLACSSNCIG